MPSTIAPTTSKAKTIKIKKKNLAILEAPDSTPLNPNMPAIRAITKKMMAQVSMGFPVKVSINNKLMKLIVHHNAPLKNALDAII